MVAVEVVVVTVEVVVFCQSKLIEVESMEISLAFRGKSCASSP